jgi:hypothetical protein
MVDARIFYASSLFRASLVVAWFLFWKTFLCLKISNTLKINKIKIFLKNFRK